MQLMKEGGKWELYIPSELAYGDNGAGGLIPGGGKQPNHCCGSRRPALTQH